ncbi:MAG: tetratricopeptide repeat protein [Elusimicrobia bacterium]|nr:tetratricopeptide repeat protein [Elusimicrobiota bacterium]
MRMKAALPSMLALLTCGCALFPPPRTAPRDALMRGDRALHHGRFTEAEELLTAALRQAEALGPEDPSLIEPLNVLGDLHAAQGRLTQAEPLFRRALAVTEKVHGAKSPQAAAGLVYLGELHSRQGKTVEARRDFERAMKISAASGRKTELAARLNDLALLYEAEGRDDDAEAALKKSLSLTERALGKEHLTVAVRLTDLALLYQTRGRYADAEPLYLRALAIKERTGSKELDTELANLALFYEAQERFAEAEVFYKRALSWTEETFGRTSRRLVPPLTSYASLLRRLKRSPEAERLETRSRSISSRPAGKKGR